MTAPHPPILSAPTLAAIIQLCEQAGVPAGSRSALRERLDYFAADLFPEYDGFFSALFTSPLAMEPLAKNFSLWDLGMLFWRERGASLDQRRKEGCFYTPAAAVDAVLDRVWQRLFPQGKPDSAGTVFDPAVGCGFFPLRIVERLRRDRRCALGKIREWAASCLYAIDIDPAAVFMTRVILWLALSNRSGEFVPPRDHILQADALLQFDCAVFPTIHADRGFAAIVGNPPYEVLTNFSRHPERRELAQALRQSGLYRDALSGQVNLYRCFIERGLDWLKPMGEMAMVVPLSLARDAAALPLRRRLIEQCGADEWLLFGEDANLFPGVTQSACVFRCRNSGESSEKLRIIDAGNNTGSGAGTASSIRLKTLAKLTGGALTLPQLNRDGAKLLTWLADNCPGRIGDVAECRVGEVDQTVYRDCMRDDDTGSILARGAHLTRFRLDVAPTPGKARFLDLVAFLQRKGGQAEPVRARSNAWRIAQLGIRNMHSRPRLVAALIPPGVYAGNSLNLYAPKADAPESISPDYLAALLNSSILDWLFRLASGNNNINLHEMHRLPFPTNPPLELAEEAAAAFRACARAARDGMVPAAAQLRLDRAALACYRLPDTLAATAQAVLAIPGVSA